MLSNLGKKIMLFDGAFGSELVKYNVDASEPVELNIDNPEIVKKIKSGYSNADFITTNTFGLNRIKYKGKYTINDLALEAINIAKADNQLLFFDIGPTGAMLKPLGLLSFDEAYAAFKEIAEIAAPYVDGFICETFADIYELKACVLAIKETTNKPIFATMTFDKTERTLTGTTPEIMVKVLEGLGVQALGVNCSLGPKDLEGVITRILNTSHTPVIIQPNRGLPKIKDGKTYYDMSASEFKESIKKYIEMGVSIIGGCCGTDSEIISSLAEYKGLPVNKKDVPYDTSICSSTNLVKIENIKICGERLNPTGKKKLKEAIINENYDYLIHEAIKQADQKADLLDLNLGVPKINEPEIMKKAIMAIQEYVDLPLQIDSSNPEAIEVGCRYYNGVPLINSVNGNDGVMNKIFPIAKKYGAVVLGLAMDENGVPGTAEKRVEIAKHIIDYAMKFGIRKENIMIDTLVLTASAEQKLVKETLKALKMVSDLGIKTALGVSNVSFGLPQRGLLNKTFLSLAMANGLNMPILNPLDAEMVGAINAYNVLMNIDVNSTNYIEAYKDAETIEVKPTANITILDAILKGLKSDTEALVIKALETNEPLNIINNELIPALKTTGDLYDKGKIYLPQLISAAEAAKAGFNVITNKFPASDTTKATILLCTVYGDVHDIGKNICKVILESYGYKVIDLGKDTPINTIIDAYNKYKPFAIGLSALMTTTVISMENTIKALRDINCKSLICVGGAVLTGEIAKNIGADIYSKDALEFVNKLDERLK